jgi:DNA repair photolyase
MQQIPAKTIITKTKNSFWFGADYNMNIYRGCPHGCIYCDSRSECYGIDEFDTVRSKEDAVVKIEAELRKKRRKGVIATGAMSDPYNPFEKKYELTKQALESVDRYGFGIAIATKSDLVVRDAERLSHIQSHSPVIVKLTITTADDALSRIVEPHAPLSSARFRAIRELSGRGIHCGILMMPVLPFIEDTEENVIAIVHKAKEHGAKFIYADFGVTLRANQRVHFLRMLDENFPGLKKQYIETFRNEYICPSPNQTALWKVFKRECESAGILYRMQDIIRDYRKAEVCENSAEQTSFLDLLG